MVRTAAAEASVQRVLDRLDHGETLNQGYLYNGDKFCVLGLFADECGLGFWQDSGYHFKYSDQVLLVSLNTDIADYYNMRHYNGLFKAKDLPEDVLNKLKSYECHFDYAFNISISGINDELLNKGIDPNPILADIIRSGVIYKQDDTEDELE